MMTAFLLGALATASFYGLIWIIIPMFAVQGPIRFRLSFALQTLALLVWPPMWRVMRQVNDMERVRDGTVTLQVPTDDELHAAFMDSILNHHEVGRIEFSPTAMRASLAKYASQPRSQ